MKALVYHGPGKRALEDKPKPVIKTATDAIVKITKTTICNGWNITLQDMQIRSTNGRLRDFDDGICCSLDDGLGLVLQCAFAWTMVHERFHW